MGFVVYFFVHMINLLRKQKTQYFYDFWNFLDFFTLILAVIAIAMYAMKIIFGNMAMSILNDSGSGELLGFGW